MSNKKHKLEPPDWLLLACEILFPLVSLACVVFIKSDDYDVDSKIATVVTAIALQIILLSFQQKQNKNHAQCTQESLDKLINVPNDIKNIQGSMDVLSISVRVNENIDKIISKGEEKRKSFVNRRLAELDRVLENAASQPETELLSVSDYYSELNNLADIIQSDSDSSKCEIWAMTGFSDEEWHDEESDLESKWGKRIKKLSMNFNTKRICIIDERLAQLLKMGNKEYYNKQKQVWESQPSDSTVIQEKRLKSFFDYLLTYNNQQENIAYKLNSYVLKDANQTYAKLIQEKGFFGIKLSDENKYVIKGEAVNPATGLQGKFVFSDKDIKELYELHNRACADEDIKSLKDFLESESCSEFKAFLHDNGINVIN